MGGVSTKEPEVQFQFVNSTVDNPVVPQDVATRALIRKQAMKKASAARKKSGSYGKHNLRQYPVFVDGPIPTTEPHSTSSSHEGEFHKQQTSPELDHECGATVIDSAPSFQHAKLKSHLQPTPIELLGASVPASLPLTAFESMSMRYGINILDLSNLTTFHVSRATRKALATDPSQVINMLSYNQWSFFSYLSTSYETSPCVRSAVDCVIARVRQILSPSESDLDSTVITHYVKALGTLQKALECQRQRYSPEVLYAIEILALYELLASSEPTAWIRHSAGAAHLIQLRGPRRYKTEFEKSLFMAHVGTITTEAMFNNEHCFLEQDNWREVFESVIVDDDIISDRSEIVISLLMIKSKIPGICADATTAVCGDKPPEMSAVVDLASRAQQARDSLIKWRCDYEPLLGPLAELCKRDVDDDKKCKVMGVYLSCMMLVNRLLSSVSAPKERLELEDEIDAIADQVLDLYGRVAEIRPQSTLFLAQTIAIAKAMQATTPLWRDISPDGGIERWKFEKFCEIIGRKC
ncbi:hypothetical protein BP5796_11390 [Coleophoma crateriformis]|uniref:Uncharacterized protein n=1 Tax=Coleophoma crateriformis TaxID=565419 RepID=A0A3D8QIH1_9HELO|nr:hypothetical protein BP5796_11390 [Coleophoma crateriformis]